MALLYVRKLVLLGWTSSHIGRILLVLSMGNNGTADLETTVSPGSLCRYPSACAAGSMRKGWSRAFHLIACVARVSCSMEN